MYHTYSIYKVLLVLLAQIRRKQGTTGLYDLLPVILECTSFYTELFSLATPDDT